MVKIMIFLHGTAIMHKNAQNRTREERVQQVLAGEESACQFAAYVPVGNVVQKLRLWENQGAEIVYLSSHQKEEDVEKDEIVLRRHGFPAGPVFFRQGGEQYHEIAERILPDILIEDDCESIGGETQMTYPHIQPELKARIQSIVVKEFGGIDHLPDGLPELRKY